MEWQAIDAKSLAIIDREVGQHTLSPSEYEIIRRVIYATADFEYKQLIRFSDQALQAGAAALAARTTVIVDVPTVLAGISAQVQTTFSNPIYCSTEAITRPQKSKAQTAWGIETLAHRYPEAIFVIGDSQMALMTLLDLVEADEVKPALVIGVPSGFVDVDVAKSRLQDSLLPHVRVDGRKGSAVVAIAIFNALLDLAWQAYGKKTES
ncbi:precorrin-8X methylmutase [Thalassoporum mexicanum PCC 7367]|uniref:precorrin-8X methylmutase n=1 Tax=Thalassoporum mexicanum TaxID=3457544 RepID=UPI00029FC7E8|nr:precorrin-8X methylmutase [Pseudanabaena sp. PCC 7367]AFY68613.1 precorrin-8X methylmutase [Pseudanabaena sp. PCC 7367]